MILRVNHHGAVESKSMPSAKCSLTKTGQENERGIEGREQTDRQAGRQAGRQTDRQAERQTDRQTVN